MQVAWADGAFGAVLASTCGYSLHIWRESAAGLAPMGSEAPAWQLNATLSDADSPLVELRFAPRGHGELWLAAASANGTVR